MTAIRQGIVLPTVLLALVVLELLTVTAVTIALQQRAAARERADAVRAQLAARAAASGVAARWQEGRYQRLAPGQSVSIGPSDAFNGSTVERIADDLFLVRSAVRTPGGARAAANLLVAGIGLLPVRASLNAAATVGGQLLQTGSSVLDGSRPDQIPVGWSGRCPARPSSEPKPALLVAESAAFDRLGATDVAALELRADRIETGSIELAPAFKGTACDTAAPGNWGAPLDPRHPCADYQPLIVAPADLTIQSGAGQGILIVRGDLTLQSGVEFYGLILVQGRMLASGARIVGALMVRSEARSSLLHDSEVSYCTCAIERALTESPALNRPIFRRGRSWLPAF